MEILCVGGNNMCRWKYCVGGNTMCMCRGNIMCRRKNMCMCRLKCYVNVYAEILCVL